MVRGLLRSGGGHVHKIYEANDKAHSYGAPQQIHGLWYRYCEESGVYHALMSNVESADKFCVSPAEKNVQGSRDGRGRGNLKLVSPPNLSFR